MTENQPKGLRTYTATVLTGILLVLTLIYFKLPKQYTIKEFEDQKIKPEDLPATYITGGSVNVGYVFDTVDVKGEVDIGSVRDTIDVDTGYSY